MMKKSLLLMTLLFVIIGSSVTATINAEGVSTIAPLGHGVDH